MLGVSVVMKEIVLTQGKVCLVDDEDYGWLIQWRWYAVKTHGARWYARATMGGGNTKVYMHRWILQVPRETDIDHKDNNGLNNQRSNLRLCSHRENMRNQKVREQSMPKTSCYKGVYLDSDTSRWRARLHHSGGCIHLGYFEDEVEAAKAYNDAAVCYYGDFARLNSITPRADVCSVS